MSTQTPISGHPDLMELRARFERTAETPAAQLVDGLTVIAGLYVALSPWILGFDNDPRLSMSNLVIGLTVALMGLAFAWAYDRTHRISWVCPALGVWTILSAWLIAGTDAGTSTVVSNIISGAVVVVLGLATMMLGLRRNGNAGPTPRR
jgi:SPW repeat